MHWAAIVFGWPAAFISVLLGITGLIGKRWTWVLAGAVTGLPFLFYLSGTPRCGLLAVAAALSYSGAVAAASRRRIGLAWLLFAPMLLLVGYVAAAVAGVQLP